MWIMGASSSFDLDILYRSFVVDTQLTRDNTVTRIVTTLHSDNTQ